MSHTRAAAMLIRLSIAATLCMAALPACGVRPSSDATSLLLSQEELYSPAELRVGDPAPPIVIGEWLRGDPIERFEPGRIYLVDFWASWCGPCLHMMERSSLTQDRYGPHDVTLIAVTALDAANSRRAVLSAFHAHEAEMRFHVAIDGGPGADATTSSYMNAARETGIPRTFVVDQQGRIAWIGHPQDVEPVLDALLADSWDLSAAAKKSHERADQRARARPLVDQWIAASRRGDVDAELLVLEELTTFQPSNIPMSPPFILDARHIAILAARGSHDDARRSFARAVQKPDYHDEPWALAEFASSVAAADLPAAKLVAGDAEEIVSRHETVFNMTADDWEKHSTQSQRDWDAQALTILAAFWHAHGASAHAVALMEQSLAMSAGHSDAMTQMRRESLAVYRQGVKTTNTHAAP